MLACYIFYYCLYISVILVVFIGDDYSVGFSDCFSIFLFKLGIFNKSSSNSVKDFYFISSRAI